MKVESIAAIDVGSNAIRLLINNVEDYEAKKSIKKNAYIRVPVRLGEDVFEKGSIGEKKQAHLLETMLGFRHLMRAFDIKQYAACATSAMREAKNGQEVTDFIAAKTDIRITIINGAEEADLIYEAGDMVGLMDPDKCYLHVDVGGGSTEVAVYDKHEKVEAMSFPIGTIRILTGAMHHGTEQELINILKTIHKKYSPVGIIASGGNINKTLKLLNKKDGDSISIGKLREFYKTLAALSFEERLEKYKMNSYRADVIVPALYIFLTVGENCKVKTYTIPKVGLVDGIIRQLYSGKRNAHIMPD